MAEQKSEFSAGLDAITTTPEIAGLRGVDPCREERIEDYWRDMARAGRRALFVLLFGATSTVAVWAHASQDVDASSDNITTTSECETVVVRPEDTLSEIADREFPNENIPDAVDRIAADSEIQDIDVLSPGELISICR